VKKVMTKTDLPYNTAGDLRFAGDPLLAIDDSDPMCGRRLVLFSS
jgi:hypothetical protein